MSAGVIGIKHSSGMLYFLKSEGRTPSHLISRVVSDAESYDIFLDPVRYLDVERE